MESLSQFLAKLMGPWSQLLPPEGVDSTENFIRLLQSSWYYASPVISIVVVTYLIYKGYNAFVAAGAQELLITIALIALLFIVSMLLQLEFLLWILERSVPTLLVMLAVILQPELRRIFVQIGRQSTRYQQRHQNQDQKVIDEIVKACETLSDRGRGALIVFRREHLLRHILSTGISLDAQPSAELIVSLFAYDTPLHDGAIILGHARVLAAACILPIDPEEKSLISMKSGTRHRSALGLIRETDAVALIVSEESGRISLAFDSQMRSHVSAEQANKILGELLLRKDQTGPPNKLKHFFHQLSQFILHHGSQQAKASTASSARTSQPAQHSPKEVKQTTSQKQTDNSNAAPNDT